LNAAKVSASHKINDITTTNSKVLDLWPDTFDAMKSSNRMTTDQGVKVQDTDHWLQIVSDKQGPLLLEDHIAREKIMRCELAGGSLAIKLVVT